MAHKGANENMHSALGNKYERTAFGITWADNRDDIHEAAMEAMLSARSDIASRLSLDTIFPHYSSRSTPKRVWTQSNVIIVLQILLRPVS